MKRDSLGDGARFPSRIVVRGTNWVGDTIMSVPALRELRRLFPDALLACWVPKGLGPLVQATGVVDELITFDASMGGAFRRVFIMRGRLAEGRFDLAVLFQNAFESAITAFLAGMPLRAGFPTDGRGILLNLPIPIPPGMRDRHEVYSYIAITDSLAAHYGRDGYPQTAVPDCTVSVPKETSDAALNLLQRHGLGRDVIFCLCPGSVNSEAKRWPADSFAWLGDLLVKRFGARIVFLGAPGERGLIEGIQKQMTVRGSVNLAGDADMVLSMAVMNLSTMVISNDTGSAHLAVAAGGRVLTIFGPTRAGATAPFGPTASIVQGTAPCAPCRSFHCPRPGHECMRSITPESVLNAVVELLDRPNPGELTGRSDLPRSVGARQHS
jgi:heptosyltransferase II